MLDYYYDNDDDVFIQNVEEIYEYEYYGEGIRRVFFYSNLKKIPESAFEYNNIKDIKLPYGLEVIATKAFRNNKLKYVVIPDTVTYIGKKAFDNIKIKYKRHIYNQKFIKKFGCESIIMASKILEIYPTFDFKKLDKRELRKKYKNLKKEIKEIKLKKYSKMKVPELNADNVDEIFNYGSVLTEQTELITTQFSEFAENKIDMIDETKELQESIKRISIKNNDDKKSFFLIKKKPKIIELSLEEKKQVLDQLRSYLIEHAEALKQGINEFQYIQKSIAVFLIKANEYLKNLNKAKKELQQEIVSKKYFVNDLNVYNDQLRNQLLDDKIVSISTSIIQMIQQYQRITIQMRTHASLLNYVNLAKGTKLQNLYIELALAEEGSKEQNSIETLDYLVELLDDLTINNKDIMSENISKINTLNTQGKNIVIDDEIKQTIERIFEEQNVLNKEKVKNKAPKKIENRKI